MSIRHFFIFSALGLGLSAGPCLPAVAQNNGAQSATHNAANTSPKAGAATFASPPVASTPLSISQALEAARNNLDVSLARRALAAAQGDVAAADHAPAPTLSAKAASIDLQNGIGGGNLFSQKRIDKGIGLDWTWERGNKRALRTLAAQRIATAAQADIGEAQEQQQLATSAAFYDVLAAQERIEQLSAIASSAAQLASTAARRVKAGDLAAQDASRTEIEAQRAATDVVTARFDRQRVALVLAQLTGFAGPGMQFAQPDWPAKPAPDDAFTDLNNLPNVDKRDDVLAAQQRVEAARAALDLAGSQKKADITVGSSFDHYPGTSTRLLEVRMQMPLYGLFGGYNFQGEIARAQAQLEQAQDQYEKTRRTATAELQRLQQDKQGAAARQLSYDDSILPRARKVADMAELAYTKGAMSLTELIDARRTLRSILIEDLAARTDYAKAAQAWLIRQK
ncbi:MAG: TolC family protein [Chitinophagaceae bacterium]|nr:TolC family protein [Polaromonas sp.]